MNKLKQIISNNAKLFSFIGLSYFDKMVIFLLPLAVLQLFQDKSEYITVEYIYSVAILIIPFLDLGISGYFFYAYRNASNYRKVVAEVLKIFHLIYLALMFLGLAFIFIHYLLIPFEEYIVYIVFRCLFLLVFTFLTSYYRLINKPQKALFVTMSANIFSLLFVLTYFFLGKDFEYWLIFLGQIIFCVVFFFQTLKRVISKWTKSYKIVQKIDWLKKSFLFSWPNIIQVFILMYVANYGKINALENLSVEDGVLLSLTQRFSMLIHLTHTAIMGFLLKDLFVSEDVLAINKNIFIKYVLLLLSALVIVVVFLIGYMYIVDNEYTMNQLIFNIGFIVSYTFTWCVYSHFEIYYSRENKNILKLYLAIFNGTLFIGIFNALQFGYLERITLAMFLSTFVTLLLSMFILRRRNYKLV
ncbi:MAG: hypothetical protein HRT73_03255 [Flavobacteriales bacterium]|nr:hypothetical protein [Flavobacteriales bacterium]